MKRLFLTLVFALLSTFVASADDRPNVSLYRGRRFEPLDRALGSQLTGEDSEHRSVGCHGHNLYQCSHRRPCLRTIALWLMSGRRPWVSGCYMNGHEWRKYQKPGEGLSAQFLKAGYYVSGAGKIYHQMDAF